MFAQSPLGGGSSFVNAAATSNVNPMRDYEVSSPYQMIQSRHSPSALQHFHKTFLWLEVGTAM
jgi:hypothetical protein